jgi:hypothetical protein
VHSTPRKGESQKAEGKEQRAEGKGTNQSEKARQDSKSESKVDDFSSVKSA